MNVRRKASATGRRPGPRHVQLLARAAAALALAAAAPLAASPDDNLADWLKARHDRFAEVSARNVGQPAELVAIKAKTAALVGAAPPLQPAATDAPPVIWRATDKPEVILDDPVAPRMVVVPAGEFTMGSATGARRRVRIGYSFAVSMFPIVFGEFAQFVAESGYRPRGGCTTFENGSFAPRANRGWASPGFTETPRNTATCIGYDDAVAYAAWLSRKTGHAYRLLSEAEYEYAERAGTTTTYWWGDDLNAACPYANGFDQDAQPFTGSPAPIACHDGNATVSRVGIYKANAFGLFDTAGDVVSWTADCWSADIARTPTDGSPATGRNLRDHALRGGSWATTRLGSADRERGTAGQPTSYQGFRLARLF